MRVVFVAIGVTACAHDAGPEPSDPTFPTRIVTPLCADAHPPVARADQRGHAGKPRVDAAFEPYCTTWFDLEVE